MPMHDWLRVEACIFHALHHLWISSISDALNVRFLPKDYYALPEQIFVGCEPDYVLSPGQGETEVDFYRRKKSAIAIRHVSGDRLVAMIEIVSPGNKSNRHGFQSFVDKACELLEHRIHLLLVDPFPPSPRDPNGIHAAIWEELENKAFVLPPEKPLTLVSYECDLNTRAYIETVAVGDVMPDMPLFLEPHRWVAIPLEATYQTAFAVMPKRWRDELQPPTAST